MRYYIDTEFNGHGGELLSLAVVDQYGRSLYLINEKCYKISDLSYDTWIQQNVLANLTNCPTASRAMPLLKFGQAVRDFFNQCDARPEVVADSPVDIGRLCEVLSTGEDGQWRSTDYSRMWMEVHNVDCYPTDLPGAVQHNAWWDAMALRHKLQSL